MEEDMDEKEKKIRKYICSSCDYTDEAIEILPEVCPDCNNKTLVEKVIKHN